MRAVENGSGVDKPDSECGNEQPPGCGNGLLSKRQTAKQQRNSQVDDCSMLQHLDGFFQERVPCLGAAIQGQQRLDERF